jgi:O-methyltransferase involved in polyketide biosynthesis
MRSRIRFIAIQSFHYFSASRRSKQPIGSPEVFRQAGKASGSARVFSTIGWMRSSVAAASKSSSSVPARHPRVRKQAAGVTYFEIDDADILNFKKERFSKAGIEAQIVYIPGNYVDDDLLCLLGTNGFDFSLPTYVIWEGNTIYLNRPAVLEVLTELRSSVAKFASSFDYLTEAVINDSTGDEEISDFVKRFAEMGAPWTFGIDDLDALAGDAGLTVVNDIKMAELFRIFLPNRQLDSKWYDNYAVCTLAAQ